jgi:hypothetical protein
MNENTKLLESLLNKASDYGKTSLELIKLKTLDKTADVVSSFVPKSVVIIFVSIFLLFLNLGLALYLGDLLGKIFFGFFAVAAFYILAGAVMHFFMHKQLKRLVADYFIKQVLK